MLTRGLPLPLNISLVAKVEKTVEIAVINPDGSARDVSYYTFDGVIVSADGAKTPFRVDYSDTHRNTVLLRLPALEYGEYEYAVVATTEDGDEESFLVGTLGAHWGGIPEAAVTVDSPNSYAVVRLPDEDGYSSAKWKGTNRIDSLLQGAEDVLKAAMEAAEKLEKVEGVLAILDGKLHSVIIPNEDTNTWWIGGIDTGAQVTGDPGKSPQISTSGTWLVWDLDTKTWKDTGVVAVARDGRSPYVNGAGYWVEWDGLKNEWVQTPYKAAGRDGLDGTVIRRILVERYEDIPQSGDTCNGGYYYYVPKADSDSFDVYAWIEHPDGTSAWVRVDIAYDIATSEVYGLTKLGTDLVVSNGAPVGTNAGGQMEVPVCDYTLPGSSRPSSVELGGDGGSIFVDGDGRYWCSLATSEVYGAVKYSTSTPLESVNVIGLNAEGKLDVQVASSWRYGVVKAGSYLSQLNSQPYQLGIGIAPNGQLANNLLTQGALKHMKKAGWVATGMDWVTDVNLNQDSFYTGLQVSAQFSQNSEEGLVLESATASTLAGVYLATGIDDTRPAAVLSASQATTFFYRRGELYTKEEINTMLTSYLTREDAGNTYLTKQTAAKDFVQQGSGAPTHIGYMSRKQFTTGLSSIPKGHIIFVY